MRGRSAGAMPTPVSRTATSTRPSPAVASTATSPPGGVYFTALSTRLMRIWARRSRSAWTPRARGRRARQPRPQPHPARVGLHADDVEGAFHHLGEGHWAQLQGHAPQLDIRQIGEVIEETPEALGMPEYHLEE